MLIRPTGSGGGLHRVLVDGGVGDASQVFVGLGLFLQGLFALGQDDGGARLVAAAGQSLAEARAVIGRWRHDYNHVRPHSAHDGLAPETVRMNHAAGRLRDVNSYAARPLPPEPKISYEACGPILGDLRQSSIT